jgi:dTDP-4-dehydrorhamnose reductase
MSRKHKSWLFGPTSIIGWQIWCTQPELRTFCNPYVRSARKLPWERLLLEDRNAISAKLAEGAPDLLIHCGGVCDVGRCEQDPAWTQRVNVDSVRDLLQVLPEHSRLVYVSSDHVYGHRDAPCDEHTPRRPVSLYGRGRVAAEDLVMPRPNSLVIRPGLPIGPSFDGRSGHLDWLRYRSARELPITIVEDEVRSAVWSADLAIRILALAESAICGVRNIAATRAVSRPVLAAQLCGHLEITPPLRFETRTEQPAPHLGRVELASCHEDALARPLNSPITAPACASA